MTTYISILRGINVSGKKLIKMDALKAMYEQLGFQNAITYVQSGNVVFSSEIEDSKNLEQLIKTKIKEVFDFEVPIIVLTKDELAEIVANNPFSKDATKDKEFLHFTFLAAQPGNINVEDIASKKQEGEDIAFSNKVIYLYCPLGYGNTKLSTNFLESQLKVEATTRNYNTTTALLKLALIK